MNFNSTSISCSLREAEGLRGVSPAKFIKEVKEDIKEAETPYYAEAEYNPPERAYVFSDLTRDSPGAKIAAYLKRRGIGRVTKSHSYRNFKTGKYVSVWVWTPPLKYYTFRE